jgi:uncharacterized protein YhhL (DUF1145 family)
MLKIICQLHQPLLIVFWCAFIYRFITPFSGTMDTVIFYVGVIFIPAHLLEWFVIRDRLYNCGHQGKGTFAKVMIFGFTWWLPIIKAKQGAGE